MKNWPKLHEYGIEWTSQGPKGVLRYYSIYKGEKFEGWISLENFQKAETDGILKWNEDGNPIISTGA